MSAHLAPEIPSKTVSEDRPFTMDFAADLDTDETISTAEKSITPATGAPTLSAATIDGSRVQVKASGGTPGIYEVAFRITTNQGNTKDGRGRLSVRED